MNNVALITFISIGVGARLVEHMMSCDHCTETATHESGASTYNTFITTIYFVICNLLVILYTSHFLAISYRNSIICVKLYYLTITHAILLNNLTVSQGNSDLNA